MIGTIIGTTAATATVIATEYNGPAGGAGFGPGVPTIRRPARYGIAKVVSYLPPTALA
jgi:hypothetical protein